MLKSKFLISYVFLISGNDSDPPIAKSYFHCQKPPATSRLSVTVLHEPGAIHQCGLCIVSKSATILLYKANSLGFYTCSDGADALHRGFARIEILHANDAMLVSQRNKIETRLCRDSVTTSKGLLCGKVLHRLEQMAHKELGKIQNLPAGTVSSNSQVHMYQVSSPHSDILNHDPKTSSFITQSPKY